MGLWEQAAGSPHGGAAVLWGTVAWIATRRRVWLWLWFCGRAIYALYEQAGSLMGVLWPCRRAYRRAIARRRPRLGDRGPFGAVNLHRLHDKSVLFRRRPFQIEVGVQVVGPPVCG